MGALLGRISPIQLLVMGLIEIILFASNEYLQIELMKVWCYLKLQFQTKESNQKYFTYPHLDC